MKTRSTIRITKTEAAERQLNQAIRLVFQRGDMLSVHTLAGASFQLLADLGKPQNILSPLRHSDRIRPEAEKEWLAALNRTQNFLKHADRDGDATHDYSEDATLMLVFEVVVMAQLLGLPRSREVLAYEAWFAFNNPSLIKAAYMDKLRSLAKEAGVDPSSRENWHRWLSAA